MEIETKNKLKKFIEDRKFTRSQDLGLIIIENKNSFSKNFWQSLNKKIFYLQLNDLSHQYQKVKNAILKAQKQKRILLLEINVDLDPWVVQILREISHFGTFNLHDERGNFKETIEISPGSLIVIAKRDFIEKGISYPNFYNIFDSAIIL